MHSFVIHSNDFACMNDFYGKPYCGAMAFQFSTNGLFRADKSDTNAILPRRLDRTFDLRLRRPVRTHCVQSYDAWHGDGRLTIFLNTEDFAAFVITTFRTSAMGLFALVTIWTLRKRRCRQKIMGAPCAGAFLRVPPFWIRHLNSFYSRTSEARQIL